MRMAITSDAQHLFGKIAPSFEKAKYYLFVDTANLSGYEYISNPFRQNRHDIPMKCGEFLLNRGTQVLLTGKCSVGSMECLKHYGIVVFGEISGNILVNIDMIRRERNFSQVRRKHLAENMNTIESEFRKFTDMVEKEPAVRDDKNEWINTALMTSIKDSTFFPQERILKYQYLFYDLIGNNAEWLNSDHEINHQQTRTL
ncbi:MAG: NifB/NifX family molybdenum-iron cluster-binding protein [Calditrichia bacterium]